MPLQQRLLEIPEGWDGSILSIFLKVKTLFSSFALLKSIFFGDFPLWINFEITLKVGWDNEIGNYFA